MYNLGISKRGKTMNTVTLVGRTGQDPEIKYYDSGKIRTTFSVAVNRWDASTKSEATDWWNLEVWDKQAEVAGEYIKKGRMVAIDGYLRFNKWTTPDGENHSRPVVRITNFRLLGGRNE